MAYALGGSVDLRGLYHQFYTQTAKKSGILSAYTFDVSDRLQIV